MNSNYDNTAYTVCQQEGANQWDFSRMKPNYQREPFSPFLGSSYRLAVGHPGVYRFDRPMAFPASSVPTTEDLQGSGLVPVRYDRGGEGDFGADRPFLRVQPAAAPM